MGAGILAAAGFLPYEWVRAWLDRHAADGSADAYTPLVHGGILRRLAYAGPVLIVVGLLVGGTRGALAAAAGRLRRQGVRLGRDARIWVRAAWSEAPVSHRVALGLVLVVGIAVRGWLLASPMRYDESFTFLTYARDPLVLGLTRYDTPNNHLFHTFLVHVAYRLVGDAPWALRLPALLGGLLVMPASYLTVRALYGRHAALVGTALVAVSMAEIEISTNARGYTLLTLAFLLLVCLAAHLRRADTAAGWIAFVGLAVMALYTIPIAVYALASVGAWLVLSAAARDVSGPPGPFVACLVAAAVATAILTGLLYAPILIRTDLATLRGSYLVSLMVTPLPWDEFVRGNLEKFVGAWHRWVSDWPRWVEIVWLAGVAAALVFHRRVARHRVPFLAGVVTGCVPLLLVQRVLPRSRGWVFLLPVFAGMGAAGVLHLLDRLARAAPGGRGRGARAIGPAAIALALLLVVGGVLALPARNREYVYTFSEFPGAEAAVTYLAPRLRAGDKIVVLGVSQTPFLYYCHVRRVPCLEYYQDHQLLGWAGLAAARRVFIVVNEREYRLDDLLARAGIADGPRPIEVTPLTAGAIYVVTRD